MQHLSESQREAINTQTPHVALLCSRSSCFFGDDDSKSVPARPQQGSGLCCSAAREALTSSLLTWYPRDGDLPATVAIPALSEGLYLDDILLIGGQRQLHRGGVGLHDAGVAVLILLVEHLRRSRESAAAAAGAANTIF